MPIIFPVKQDFPARQEIFLPRRIARFSLKEEQVYEEKIDKISEYLEELIFDAMLSALRKIKERNMLFDALSKKAETDDISF